MKILKNFLGRIQTKCENFKCNNKAFGEYAGSVFCRKHYINELLKDYGSLKRAKRYVKKYYLAN